MEIQTLNNITAGTQLYTSTQVDAKVAAVSTNISTDLDAKVAVVSTELKQTLYSDINSKCDLIFTTGYYIKLSDGSFVQDAHGRFGYTNEIYNSGSGSKVIYKNIQCIKNVSYAVAAYDVDGNILKERSLYTNDDETKPSASIIDFEEGTFEFTDDVAYIRLGITTTTEAYKNNKVSNITILSNDLTILSNDLNVLSENNIILSKNTIEQLQFSSGYINANGKFNEHATYQYSEKIFNNDNKPVNFKQLKGANGVAYCLAAYDSNDNVIKEKSLPYPLSDSSITSGKAIYIEEGTFEFTDDVAYIRLSFNNPMPTTAEVEYYVYETLKNDIEKTKIEFNDFKQTIINSDINGSHWYGKKWYAYGTSLTKGSTTTPAYYADILAEKSGLVLTNKGIPGGTISLSSDDSIYGKAEILNTISSDAINGKLLDVDLITIEGFVNDWNYGRPIGTYGDIEISTLHGGLETALKYCLLSSNATIVVLTDNGGKVSYLNTSKNKLNMTQRQFNDEIINISKFMNVNCIDVAGKAQINQYNPQYISDSSVHHTELGGKQYADTIWDDLKNIHCINT